MGAVSEEEQEKRSRGFAVFFIAAVMGVPIVGQLVAMFMAGLLAIQIFTKSSTRLVDFGILLIFTVVYLVAIYVSAVSMKSLWAAGISLFVISLIGLSILQRRSKLLD